MSEELKIPKGATHFLPANELDFNQKPDFMKWDYNFTGPESGNAYHCWYNYHQGEWHKDITFWDKHKRLKPIEEFNAHYGIEEPSVNKMKPR